MLINSLSKLFFNWSMAWAVVLVDAILPSRKHLAMSGAFWVTLTGVQKLWTSKWQRSGMLLRFLPVTSFLFVITVIIQAQASILLKLKTFSTIVFLFCCSPQGIGILAQQLCCFCSYQGHRYLLQSFFFLLLGMEVAWFFISTSWCRRLNCCYLKVFLHF